MERTEDIVRRELYKVHLFLHNRLCMALIPLREHIQILRYKSYLIRGHEVYPPIVSNSEKNVFNLLDGKKCTKAGEDFCHSCLMKIYIKKSKSANAVMDYYYDKAKIIKQNKCRCVPRGVYLDNAVSREQSSEPLRSDCVEKETAGIVNSI